MGPSYHNNNNKICSHHSKAYFTSITQQPLCLAYYFPVFYNMAAIEHWQLFQFKLINMKSNRECSYVLTTFQEFNSHVWQLVSLDDQIIIFAEILHSFQLRLYPLLSTHTPTGIIIFGSQHCIRKNTPLPNPTFLNVNNLPRVLETALTWAVTYNTPMAQTERP